MPNYVRTRLVFEGKEERIKQLMDYVRTETTNDEGKPVTLLFDFNKVIPMPKALDIVSGSEGEYAMEYILYHKDDSLFGKPEKGRAMEHMEKLKTNAPEEFDAAIKLGQQYLHNIADYGCATWYDWRIRNWGTKWNASDAEYSTEHENGIEFDTAWNFPTQIVQKLSEMFPDVKVEYVYADEDSGYNTGRGIYVAGKSEMEERPAGGSREGYEIYLDTHPESRDYLLLNEATGNYEWKEDE